MPTFATTLAAAANATQSKVLVAAAAASDAGFYVQIDEEFLMVERGGNVTRRHPNTNATRVEWQVQRGQLGSVAASHADAAAVTQVVPVVVTADPVVPPSASGVQTMSVLSVNVTYHGERGRVRCCGFLIGLAVVDDWLRPQSTEIHVTGNDYQVEAVGPNPVTWTYGPLGLHF